MQQTTAQTVTRQIARAFGKELPTGFEHMHRGAVLSSAAERALDASSPREVLGVLARFACDLARSRGLKCGLAVATVGAVLEGEIMPFDLASERAQFVEHCEAMSCNAAGCAGDEPYQLAQAVWYVARLGAFIIPERNQAADAEAFRTELARTSFELAELLAAGAPDAQAELERALGELADGPGSAAV